MSNLDYKFPIGFFKKTTKYIAGHLSARAWFREILKWLNVPYYDCSCPTDVISVTGVGYNQVSGKLQYFNTSTGVWTDVPNSVLNPA